MASQIILIAIVFVVISGIMFSNVVFADIAPPKKQLQFGIDPEEVVCDDGFFKVIKKSSNTPSCVKLSSVLKLVEMGWANPVDLKLLEQSQQPITVDSGTVKKIAVIKEPSSSKIFSSNPSAVSYNYVFEACAGTEIVEFPEIIITSDSAVKTVTLAKALVPNECQISAVKIAAGNPDSINADVANEGLLANKISSLQTKLDELKQEIKKETSSLDTLLDEQQKAPDFKKIYAERIDKIVTLRTELNLVREDLNNHLFAFYLKPNVKVTDLKPQKSFAGTTIEGVLVNKLSVSEGLVTKGTYDVAFEMCASNETVRIPLVTVASDVESKTVKLSDKIIPNSCQVTGTKIKADKSDSITVSLGETGEKSNLASDLEKQIADLSAAIDIEKTNLRQLTHNPQRPADFNEQVLNLSNKIIDLRSKLNEAKAELYLLLTQIYN